MNVVGIIVVSDQVNFNGMSAIDGLLSIIQALLLILVCFYFIKLIIQILKDL